MAHHGALLPGAEVRRPGTAGGDWAAPSPDAAKRLAWASDAGLRADWDTVRDAVMLAALRTKFTQHAELHVRLLATGDTYLVEHTAKDAYWGDGGDGSGRNRLGVLLQQVRTELRQQAETETNRLILEWLFAAGRIDLRRSRSWRLTRLPPPAPFRGTGSRECCWGWRSATRWATRPRG